jgi:hypothetical protein
MLLWNSIGWRTAISRLAVLVVAAICVACAPMHTVKPLPDFVEAAIEPGDKVRITTVSGEEIEMIVTEVDEKTLHSGERSIALIEIAELKKVAWKRPPSPCGGELPLGCSVPLLVSLASDEYKHYKDEFYDACAQHDYCYRHGHLTYGLGREYCDAEFLENMKNSCPAPSSSKVGKLFEVFNESVGTRRTCLRVARDFHMAAQDFGEKHYQSESSSYCEYNGPR